MIHTEDYEKSNFSSELLQRLMQIDMTETLDYNDEFDPESTSFMYMQGLNEFKFNY